MIFYHVSTDLKHNGVFEPRIPSNRHQQQEDEITPRVQEKTSRMWDYSRIHDRMKELDWLYDVSKDIKYLMEQDSICHLLEGEGFKTYEKIASFCEEHHINRVVDIGCAYGHQSEVFLQSGIEYVGVNNHKDDFWNNDEFEFVVGTYPCRLPIQKEDLGISVRCLTWNVYLYEGEKTLHEQCKALQRDFEHCLLYVQPNHQEVLSHYFKIVKNVKGNLYYFSNKEY